MLWQPSSQAETSPRSHLQIDMVQTQVQTTIQTQVQALPQPRSSPARLRTLHHQHLL